MGELRDENGMGGETTAGGPREGAAGPETGSSPAGAAPAEAGPVPEGAAAAEAVVGPEVSTAPAEESEAPAAEPVPATAANGEPAEAPAPATPEKLARTRELVEGLLQRLGVEASVEVRDGPEAIACSVDIRSGGELFASGPRGHVLEAAQYLVNKMANREAEGRKLVSLALGGTTEKAADPALERMAIRLGEAAKRMGKTLTVVPMQSKDRRSVHVALAGVEGVRTRSEGDGLFRRLLVEPEGR
jgi:spoIIIJ-associated protein